MEFEGKLARLQEIVQKMEDGSVSLEDSLKLFEEGIKLSRECNIQLTEAEQKVKMLISVSEQGQPIFDEFKPPESAT